MYKSIINRLEFYSLDNHHVVDDKIHLKIILFHMQNTLFCVLVDVLGKKNSKKKKKSTKNQDYYHHQTIKKKKLTKIIKIVILNANCIAK